MKHGYDEAKREVALLESGIVLYLGNIFNRHESVWLEIEDPRKAFSLRRTELRSIVVYYYYVQKWLLHLRQLSLYRGGSGT